MNREKLELLRTQKMRQPTKAVVKDFFMCMSKNILTPDRYDWGSRKGGNYIYELATGTDMRDKPITGITVYYWDTDEQSYEYSHHYSILCRSSIEVEAALNAIGKKEVA